MFHETVRKHNALVELPAFDETFTLLPDDTYNDGFLVPEIHFFSNRFFRVSKELFCIVISNDNAWTAVIEFHLVEVPAKLNIDGLNFVKFLCDAMVVDAIQFVVLKFYKGLGCKIENNVDVCIDFLPQQFGFDKLRAGTVYIFPPWIFCTALIIPFVYIDGI